MKAGSRAGTFQRSLHRMTVFRLRWKGVVLFLSLLITALLALAFVSNGQAQSEGPAWLGLTGNSLAGAGPTLTASQGDGHTIDLTVSVPGAYAQEITLGGSRYTALQAEGFDAGGQPGLPDLPVLRRSLEVPAGASLSLALVGYRAIEIDLPGAGFSAPLAPVQASQPKCAAVGNEPTPRDLTAYASDAFYPAAPFRLGESFVLRGHTGQTVEIWPFAYNPASGRLRIYTWLDLRVTILGGSESLFSAGDDSSVFAPILEETFLNHLSGQARIGSTAAPVYMIVTTNAFAAGLDGLVALKQAQGFQVVENTLPAGSTTDQIKAQVAAQYNSPNRPDYLLLVGDTDTLPAWASRTAANVFTDLYYATMDGDNDYVADILVGRLPVRSSAQLQAMLANLLAYQQAGGDEAWVKKISFVATNDAEHYTGVEAVADQLISNYSLAKGYSGNFPTNPQPGGDKLYGGSYHAGTTDLLNAFNNGRAVVFYSGHGNETFWAGPALSQANVRLLSGTPAALVGAFACKTTSYAAATPESIGDTWVLQANHGALAYLGAATDTYWDEDNHLESFIGQALFTAPVSPPVGALLKSGLNDFNHWSMESSIKRHYAEAYQILGDPSLEVLTGPKPADFSLDLPVATLSVCSGSSGQTGVQITAISGDPPAVSLSASGPTSGLTIGFSPNPVTVPGTSILTLSAASTADEGERILQVLAENGQASHQASLGVLVSRALPQAPVPLAPANGAGRVELAALFTWTAVEQADGYRLQIASDAGFANVILDQADIAVTRFALPSGQLQTGQRYYWRVAAENACGSGAWSWVAQFTSLPAPGSCGPDETLTPLFGQDFESGSTGWTSTGSPANAWAVSTEQAHSPSHAFVSSVNFFAGIQDLVSPPFEFPADGSVAAELVFWSRSNFAAGSGACVNGGYLEVSRDDGATWQRLPEDDLLSGAYDGRLSSLYDNPLGGQRAWCLNSGWHPVVADLAGYTGETVRLRFRQGTSSQFTGWQWALDDLQVHTCRSSQSTYALALSPAADSRVADPGQQAEFSLTLSNPGARALTVELSASDAPWPVAFSAPTAALEPGESQEITASISVPADAPAGYNVTTYVMASVQEQPGVWQTSALRVAVHQFAISLATPNYDVTADSGAVVSIPVQIRNDGNASETITLEASGPQDWELDLPGQLELDPGQAQTINVQVSLPDWAAPASSNAVTVRAFPQDAPQAQQSLTLNIHVAPLQVFLPLASR